MPICQLKEALNHRKQNMNVKRKRRAKRIGIGETTRENAKENNVRRLETASARHCEKSLIAQLRPKGV